MKKQNASSYHGLLWGLLLATLPFNGAAGACSYELSTTNRIHGYGATTGAVDVVTSNTCPWTATTTNSWITITGGLSGSGPGQVFYSIELNPYFVERTGGVRVAGQTLQLVQRAFVCAYSISPTNRVHGYGASSGTLDVNTSANCSWTVLNTNPWISIASATNGVGPDTIGYSIEPNPFPVDRTGIIWIGGEPVTLTQRAVGCTYSISPDNRTNGYGISSGAISLSTSGAGCAWSILNTNSWITITSPTQGMGNASITYILSANPDPVPRVGLVWIEDQLFTLTQRGIICSYSISPTGRTHGYAAATGTVSVATSITCPWTIWNTNDWIIFPAGTNGLGGDTITYWVLANPVMQIRTALVTIADQSLIVTQRAAVCQYSLTPTSFYHGVGSETGLVTLTATPTCPWSVINTSHWITVTPPTNAVGNGTVGYLVAANPNPGGRTNVVTIAGESYTVKQAGTACVYVLSTHSRVHGYGATTGSIKVTTGTNCDWAVINTNDWITVTSPTNLVGSNNVTYNISANPIPAERTGVLLIAGQVVTLTQGPMPCEYSLVPTNRVHGYAATTNTVSVVVAAACPWIVFNTNEWITILSSTNGLGDGDITYRVDANSYPSMRTGCVAIADQIFTVAQRGSPCTYSLTPSSRVHGYGAMTGTVSLVTASSCGWTIINTNEWIEILSPTNSAGFGSADISYVVQTNESVSMRTGVILIGGELFNLSQLGRICTYSFSSNSATYDFAAQTSSVQVTTLAECTWTVINTNSWVSIVSNSSGEGPGILAYALSYNPDAVARTGALILGSNAFSIVQRANACTYKLSPTNRVHGWDPVAAMLSVAAPVGCPWQVVNTNDWIIITSSLEGSGNGTINYTVLGNPNPIERSGVVLVAGQPFYVTQIAAPCNYHISPLSRAHGYGATNGAVDITTGVTCTWSALNTNDWITLAETDGVGNGSVHYTLSANETLSERIALLTIASQFLTITQKAAPCPISISPTSRTHGYGGTNAYVYVIAFSGCSWSVSTTNDWIIITSPPTGSSTGTVNYIVQGNPSTNARAGAIMIGDKVLALNQRGMTNLPNLVFQETTFTEGNQLHIVLAGPLGTVQVDCSPDLKNWQPLATLTNSIGQVEFTCIRSNNVPGQFYRAWMVQSAPP